MINYNNEVLIKENNSAFNISPDVSNDNSNKNKYSVIELQSKIDQAFLTI